VSIPAAEFGEDEVDAPLLLAAASQDQLEKPGAQADLQAQQQAVLQQLVRKYGQLSEAQVQQMAGEHAELLHQCVSGDR
jgi:hypothetical protein